MSLLRPRLRSLPVVLAAVAMWLLGALFPAVDADAQRRRRRRRSPRPPVEAPATPEDPPAATSGETGAEGDDPGGERPASLGRAAGGAGFPDGALPGGAAPVPDADLGPLRTELAAVLDGLVTTRGRIEALGRQLFRTRLRVRVADRPRGGLALERLALYLDDDPVFETSGEASGGAGLDGDRVEAFTGFAAPGPHLLRVEVTHRDRRDRELRYERVETFRFEVVPGRLTDLVVRLETESDLADKRPEDEDGGRVGLRTRLEIRRRSLDRAAGDGDDDDAGEGDSG